jgi:hypothetical protein
MSVQRSLGLAAILAVVAACTSTSSTPAPTTTITLPADAEPTLTSPPLAPASAEDPADADIGYLDIATLEAAWRDDAVDLALTVADPLPTAVPASGELVGYEFLLHAEGPDLPGWRLKIEAGQTGELAGSLFSLASSQEEVRPFPGSLVVDGERLNVTLSLPEIGQATGIGVCAMARASSADGAVLAEDVAPDQGRGECEAGTGQLLEP